MLRLPARTAHAADTRCGSAWQAADPTARAQPVLSPGNLKLGRGNGRFKLRLFGFVWLLESLDRLFASAL